MKWFIVFSFFAFTTYKSIEDLNYAAKYTQITRKGFDRGRVEAQKDIDQGIMKIFYYGHFDAHLNKIDRIQYDLFQIINSSASSCVVNSSTLAFVGGYNSLSKQYIKQVHGKDFFEKWQFIIEELEHLQSQHKDDILQYMIDNKDYRSLHIPEVIP